MATESVLHIPWYDWSLKNTCSGAAAVEVYRGFLISSALISTIYHSKIE